MKKFVITRKLPEACLVEIRKEYEIVMPETKDVSDELKEHMVDAVAILDIGLGIGASLLKEAGSLLRAYGTSSVGYDHVDVAYCSSKGIAVVNTPRSVMHATSEIAIGLIFDVMRRISFYDRRLKEELVCRSGYFPMENQSLYGKTLGIVGFGRIGQCVAKKMKACGLSIVYYNSKQVSKEVEEDCGANYVSLNELLAISDIVSLHCPYREANHHMMNKETFSMMKPSAYFINTARGKLVDEEALVQALQSGIIMGAGLDVFEHEPQIHPTFASLDNVVVTPHIGTAAYDVRMEMVEEAIAGMMQVLHGSMPHNVVNEEILRSYLK